MSRGLAALLPVRRTAAQQVTLLELMNLSERQLEDIGLARASVEEVVMCGPRSVGPINPAGAIQPTPGGR